MANANANIGTSGNLIPTYIEPAEYESCYPVASGIKEDDIKNKTEDNEVPKGKDKDGNIVKCPVECLLCADAGTCQVCSLGYSLADNGTCIFCEDCRTCQPDHPEVCLSCFSPLVHNKTTNKCDKPACTEAFCLDCDSSGVCKKCWKGYSVYNNTCVKCQDGC